MASRLLDYSGFLHPQLLKFFLAFLGFLRRSHFQLFCTDCRPSPHSCSYLHFFPISLFFDPERIGKVGLCSHVDEISSTLFAFCVAILRVALVFVVFLGVGAFFGLGVLTIIIAVLSLCVFLGRDPSSYGVGLDYHSVDLRPGFLFAPRRRIISEGQSNG